MATYWLQLLHLHLYEYPRLFTSPAVPSPVRKEMGARGGPQ